MASKGWYRGFGEILFEEERIEDYRVARLDAKYLLILDRLEGFTEYPPIRYSILDYSYFR